MDRTKENYLKVFLGLFSMTLLIYIGSTLFKRARLDFTQESIYTLSEGTKSILKKLDSPIKLKFYYSKTAANKGTEGLRTFNNYSLYVQDLLRQYVDHSRNNLSLQVIDPRPDTSEEEDALAYGLKKFHLSETEKYFFGMVAENESGTEKIIEFFDPNKKDKLEYQLTKLVYQVLNPAKKTLGVLASFDVIAEEVSPMMAQIMRMQGKNVESSWGSIQALSEFYQVKKVELKKPTLTGVDTLLVLHPRGFSEQVLYAIDQYVMQGGNLIVLIDPFTSVDPNVERGISSSPDAGFKKLMEKWGVTLKEGVYAGDKYLAGVGASNPRMGPTKMITLLNCNSECSSRHKDNISAGLQNTIFVLPGVLETKQVEGVAHSTFLSSTQKGNEYRVAPYMLNNPQMAWQSFQEGSGVDIGVKAIGKFKSAYSEMPKFESKGEDKSQPQKSHLQESAKESAIVFVSDVDFLADSFAFQQTFLGAQPRNDNVNLLLNMVEALSGNVDLLNVRAKARVDRSFDVITQIELEAEEKTQDKVKEIQSSIQKFQQELNQLGRQKNSDNVAILQNESLKKRKKLNKQIATLKKDLRAVRREGREKIEVIGKMFQYFNTLFVPLLVIVFGLFFYGRRSKNIQGRRMPKQTHSNHINNEVQEVKA